MISVWRGTVISKLTATERLLLTRGLLTLMFSLLPLLSRSMDTFSAICSASALVGACTVMSAKTKHCVTASACIFIEPKLVFTITVDPGLRGD